MEKAGQPCSLRPFRGDPGLWCGGPGEVSALAVPGEAAGQRRKPDPAMPGVLGQA